MICLLFLNRFCLFPKMKMTARSVFIRTVYIIAQKILKFLKFLLKIIKRYITQSEHFCFFSYCSCTLLLHFSPDLFRKIPFKAINIFLILPAAAPLKPMQLSAPLHFRKTVLPKRFIKNNRR